MSGSDGDDRPNGHPRAAGSPELVSSDGAPEPSIEHLAENRRLIVRRALLATAVGGAIPLPVLDDYFAGRVRAGLLIKLAERRQVDIAQSSAELLGDPREGTAVRNATLTAATLLALKLAWKKFFALLAIGRRAEDMVTTFQLGTLFDHYCFKLHVGGEIDRTQAALLRVAIFGALAESERAALITAFQEGGRVLARSALEAPSWMSGRIERAARRWSETGGRTADPGDRAEPEGGGGEEARWLDRASAAVEERLGRASHSYVSRLVMAFERHLREAVASARAAAATVTPPQTP
jgi:hypothetical protein